MISRKERMLWIAIVVAHILAIASFLYQAQQAKGAPALDWDPRLDPLGVRLEPAADCSGGCWRLVSAQYEDEQESAGLHHIWAKALDEQGNHIAGQEWRVFYPGDEIALVTKAPPEWADFAMFNCYFPDRERGAYSAYMGSDQTKSDVVSGMGLPACHHVSFRLIWQWQSGVAPCVECVPRGYLPIVAR